MIERHSARATSNAAAHFTPSGFFSSYSVTSDALVRLGRLVQLSRRHDAEHDAAFGQILVRHALHVGGGHRQRLRVFGPEVSRVAVKTGAVGKRQGLAQVRLEAADELELLAGRRLLNLFCRRAFFLQPLDDRIGRRLEIGQVWPGRGVRIIRNSPTSSFVDWNTWTAEADCSS